MQLAAARETTCARIFSDGVDAKKCLGILLAATDYTEYLAHDRGEAIGCGESVDFDFLAGRLKP